MNSPQQPQQEFERAIKPQSRQSADQRAVEKEVLQILAMLISIANQPDAMSKHSPDGR